MYLFYAPDIEISQELSAEEALHCIRVLRLKEGDEIFLSDGKGLFYKAQISEIAGKRCFFSVKEKSKDDNFSLPQLHIALAPTKNIDRTEWFVEKTTEIGISEITFLNCRFSERKVVKQERITKILVSAMKQSLKATLPVLNEMVHFSEFIKRDFKGKKFIAHCYEGEKLLLKDAIQKGEEVLILIGPEGDFSEDEVAKAIELDFIPITLGNSRLRTETAGLVACHTVNLINQ